MATMMPGDIWEFETEGEKTFYKFLEGVAKPDVNYLCWYTPDVNGNEPDFLLYYEVSLRDLPFGFLTRHMWVLFGFCEFLQRGEIT